MPQNLVIFGAGGHAKSVTETALSAGFAVTGFVDSAPREATLLGYPVAASPEAFALDDETLFAIAIGDNATRERVWNGLSGQFPPERFPALIHASANVSRFAQIGTGTVVLQGAIVGAGSRIGTFCIVNTGASLDHDNRLDDFAFVAPRAATGGEVSLGRRAAIGIGAVVKPRTALGDDSLLGAGSYLAEDLPANAVAWGSPALVQRRRTKDEAYL